jgi:hypothetical protein
MRCVSGRRCQEKTRAGLSSCPCKAQYCAFMYHFPVLVLYSGVPLKITESHHLLVQVPKRYGQSGNLIINAVSM